MSGNVQCFFVFYSTIPKQTSPLRARLINFMAIFISGQHFSHISAPLVKGDRRLLNDLL